MRILVAMLLLATLATPGCPATSAPTGTELTPTSGPATQQAVFDASGRPVPAQQLTPPEQVPPQRRVWAYLEGQRRIMDMDEARAHGLTLVDLSDDWVPYIFWPQTPGKDDLKPNQHLQNYVDLANDRVNRDGHRLRRGQHNFLEVYGIPPSLSVLHRRFIDDEQKACFKSLDTELFNEYHGPVRVVDPAGGKRLQRAYHSARAAYRAALRKARVRTLEQLLQQRNYARVAKRYRRQRWRYQALLAMKKRLVCEGMYGRRVPRTKPTEVNWAVRQALKRFEKKHNVYGWGMIFEPTAQALGRSPMENNFESLKRVITDRVVSAAGILEDGSSTAQYTAANGTSGGVRDVVGEFGAAALDALGLHSAEDGRRFIADHAQRGFERLIVAVKLPSLPGYYSDQMDLEAQIHRGDIWYDLPFDDKGKRRGQPRDRLPSFTLFLRHNGERFPLVRWRTTIGGWQKEKRGEEEYYKYKVSDVGPRIWRNIVAGPVWVPPRKTPTTDLVKRGGHGRIVAQSAFGPGYASAYGLVAAYHVRESDKFDNQIRTHGTVNYMSVRRGFSHGCHRLYNYRAVRLFSFVLRHRSFERKGQARLAYKHRFEHRGEEYQINLHTRGYFYELTPPVPVRVLRGRIRGTLQEPVQEYVKKPGQLYQDDLPQRSGTKRPSAAPRTGGGTSNPMEQRQTL